MTVVQYLRTHAPTASAFAPFGSVPALPEVQAAVAQRSLNGGTTQRHDVLLNLPMTAHVSCAGPPVSLFYIKDGTLCAGQPNLCAAGVAALCGGGAAVLPSSIAIWWSSRSLRM